MCTETMKNLGAEMRVNSTPFDDAASEAGKSPMGESVRLGLRACRTGRERE